MLLGASTVPITYDIKSLFLRIHNEKRDFTAQGNIETNDLGTVFGTALRMATMIWDLELQRMALQNVFACIVDPDACRRTKHYVYAGQNLAKSCLDQYYENDEDVIINSMNAWFIEHRDLPPGWLSANGNGSEPRGKVGHFTQMVRDEAFAVGCSIVKSITSKDGIDWYCHYLACNYATGNVQDLPVYEAGPMGEKCTTGMNPNYPGLCSERENYYGNTELFE